MRGLAALSLLVLMLPPASAATDALEERLRRDPYECATRSDLVVLCRDSGNYAEAYYHAAWLTWLGGREYAESEAGGAFLRKRGNRDRASRGLSSDITPIVAAVDAKRLLYDTCLNGAIAQQAARVLRDISSLVEQAERAAAQGRSRDPVIRMALAELALTLDDALIFERTEAATRARPRLLRAAASRAQAAAALLPEAPGPHRTLAAIRSRMAELSNEAALWELAIEEAERAWKLDPSDHVLAEFLWALHLRAGHWEEAKVWQARVEAAAAECGSD